MKDSLEKAGNFVSEKNGLGGTIWDTGTRRKWCRLKTTDRRRQSDSDPVDVNTKTEDVKATVEQILALEHAGCDIIRVAVPTMEAAAALTEIKRQIHIPLVADIHFDYRLAIAAIECGADKIRINPGNIGSRERIQAVADKAKSMACRFVSASTAVL